MSILTRLFGDTLPIISVLELQEKLQDGNRPFLLDVRQPEEYRFGHIPDSILIPLGELSKRMNEVPKDREIVCICASGHRSIPAARQLIAAGYPASLENGMIAWQMAKLSIQKG